MKYILILIITLSLLGCAEKKAVFTGIQNETSSQNSEVDEKIVDNNALRFTGYLEDNLYQISLKIMDEEVKISKAKTYENMLKYIGNIKEHLKSSVDIIDRYEKRSPDTDYQRYIKYVRCTYNSLTSSYLFMETSVQKQIDTKSKNIKKFKDNLRNDTGSYLIELMKECEKIK